METLFVIGSVLFLIVTFVALSEGGQKRHFRLDCLD